MNDSGVPHGIMFHHFHGERHPGGQGSISQQWLEELLDSIGPERILDPEEWLARVESGRLREGDLCLTFDDALLCQFEIALPVLEKLDLRAFWFVYSSVFDGDVAKFEVYRAFRCRSFDDPDEFYEIFFAKVAASGLGDRARAAEDEAAIARVKKSFPFYTTDDIKFRLLRDRVLSSPEYERIMDDLIRTCGVTVTDLASGLWMTNDHLKELAERGHIVGLHSYSHPMALASLPPDQQALEYSRNFEHVRRVCGKAPKAMAHPANSYNDWTLDVLRDLDVRCGFRSNLSPRLDGGPLNPSSLELAREDHMNIITALETVRRSDEDQQP